MWLPFVLSRLNEIMFSTHSMKFQIVAHLFLFSEFLETTENWSFFGLCSSYKSFEYSWAYFFKTDIYINDNHGSHSKRQSERWIIFPLANLP